MTQITLSFLTKPDCHLCDRLLGIMNPILDQYHNKNSQAPGDAPEVTMQFTDIRTDSALFCKYRFRIPVVIDTRTDRILFEGRPDPAAVRIALQGLVSE